MTLRQAPSCVTRTGYTGFASEKVTVWSQSGKATGGVPVILVHGYQGNAQQWCDPSVTTAVAPRLGRAGATCLGTDCGGLSTWGNATMVTSIDNQISWANTNYGTRTDLIVLLMLSHGATALNWVWRNPSKLLAASLVIPALSLQGLHDRDPLGLGIQASIDLAFVDHAGYLAALPTRDPSHPTNMALLAPLASKIQLLASSNDNVCIPSETAAFSAGTGIPVTDIGAVGHTFTDAAVELAVNFLLPKVWWPSN